MRTFLTTILAVLAGSASASDISGEALNKLCIGNRPMALAYIAGYSGRQDFDLFMLDVALEGRIPKEALANLKSTLSHCTPNNTTATKLADVACDWIAKNPDLKKKMTGTEAVNAALSQIYPCSN